MHYMRVALDHHLVGELDATGLGDAPDIIASQIDEHQVLGQLLGIGQQLGFQRLVLRLIAAAGAGAGDGAYRDHALLVPHQDLRRGADHMKVLQVEEEHVGRGIKAAQRTVEIQWRRSKRNRHALGEHHLHDVAVGDVFTRLLHRGLETLLGEAGNKVLLAHLGRAGNLGAFHRLLQQSHQLVQASLTLLQCSRLGRVHVHHHKQFSAEVIEHHDFIGKHQQDVGGTDQIRIGTLGQAWLDVAHSVVAEVADQAAGELRQTIHLRHLVTRLEGLDKGQWIGDRLLLDHHVVGDDGDLVTAYAEYRARRQADDGVTPPLLAALHRLEQVGVWRISQLEVGT